MHKSDKVTSLRSLCVCGGGWGGGGGEQREHRAQAVPTERLELQTVCMSGCKLSSADVTGDVL